MDIVTLGASLNDSAEYVKSHFKGGSNIQIVDNPDGTQTINASGEVSAEDTVARADISAIKDGETLDSFGDVEAALGSKADKSTTYTKTEVDTALSAKADTTNVYSKSDVNTALDDKVDKETGKGLSTNDYTTTEKTKLAGIEAQANKTIVDDTLSGISTNPVQNKVIKSALDNKADIADIPTVPITVIQKNGIGVTPVNGTVNIIVPTTAVDVSALPDTTKYATALSLTINSSTFVVTGQLKDQNGDNLGAAQTIDLPLESVVVGGSYNDSTKKVVLTLQNGNTVEFSVADLVAGLQTELSASNKLNPAFINYDSTHRAVSDTEKTTWNGKQSALSSAQLNAVNSGIDSAKVGQISANQTEIARLVDDKSKNQLNITKTGIKSMNTAGTWSGNTYTRTDSENNLSITMNDDMSFTVNGTAATRVQFNLSNTGLGDFQNYVLSGGNVASETISVLFQEVGGSYATIGQDFGAGVELGNYDRSKSYSLSINISAGTVANNIVIKPMLCTKNSWNFSHEFVPYVPSNAELYAMIQALQS